MAVDDLDVPLGKDKARKRLSLPVKTPQLLAGLLGVSIVMVGLWTLFANDPYGGEPVAVVPTKLPAIKDQKDQTVAAAIQNGAAQQAKPGAPAVPAAPAAPPPGAKTVTIIDGSSGQKQEVVLPGQGNGSSGGTPSPAAAVDKRLLETTRHGVIPKIGPDGTRPSAFYARPVTLAAGKADYPKVALIVGGLGVSASGTADALERLPGAVTFAFTPYGPDVERLVERARDRAHEILLQVPMEPFDYPDNDPGPQALLISLTGEQNIDRLHWLMSRMQGYVGVLGYMGARFSTSDQALSPVMRETAKRGLIYVDNAASQRSVAGQIAGSQNLSFAKADMVIDAVPTATEIDRALARLETVARERGHAVGIATGLPATVARIAEWAKRAEGRGIVLVPISMAAIKPKSS